MKYKLINSINPKYSALEQVLVNRGIEYEDIPHYINTTDEDINDFNLLGKDKLWNAAAALVNTINSGQTAGVIVDSDCDGFCSSALLINYIHSYFPAWVENNLKWYIHSGKEHGIKDMIKQIISDGHKLLLVPDAGTNDIAEHKILKDLGCTIICLDHHEREVISEDAIIINSQDDPYPNKFLCGCGVTWQFCRYIDSLMRENNANKYLDLVALSLTADMMSLRSVETKYLINKGFEPDNVHNPFIYNMWQKNSFKLGDHITSWGAAFYIAPFVNAIVRSGTQEEKELVFRSMLEFEAFKMVLSTKRGHKLGEQEKLVDQAIRTCTNVKNRQNKAVDASMEKLERRIEEENMMDNKILLFLIEPGQIDKNVAGLVANKIMAKYQRPCCILTRGEEKDEEAIFRNSGMYGCPIYLPETRIIYSGSARGCDKVGITRFKDICTQTECIQGTIGHQGAFGLFILENNLNEFISKTNEMLRDMPDEPIYYVDYIFEGSKIDPQVILDIADMDSYWGKDCEESNIAIQGLKITRDMITLMSPDKNPTLKITLPNKISIIKFNSSDEEYQKFCSDGYIEVNIIGSCNANEWNGNVTPQIFMEDFEIVDSCNFFF